MELTDKEAFARRILAIEGLEQGSEEVKIVFENGDYITQYHRMDCCEWVRVEQVDGNVEKHIGAMYQGLDEKVLTMDELPPEQLPTSPNGSLTATFYTLKTSKGYLDWRWVGESNGYYSESVDCKLVKM